MAKGSGARVSTVLEVESREDTQTPMFVAPSQAPGKSTLVLKPSVKSVQQPSSVTVEIANVSPLGAIRVTGHIEREGTPGSFSMLVPGMQVIEVKEKGAPSGIYA